MIELQTLREQRFFDDLTDDELAIIGSITRKKAFALGETVFNASQEGRSLYLIRSGEVKVCMAAPDGELFTLSILKSGEIFGAMSFIDAMPRSATVMAISDVETLVLEGPDFEKIIDANPHIAQPLLRRIVHNGHAIVRAMNSRYIEMITYMWGRKRFT
jgi:CRP-like cAMP-binding protein